MIEPEAFVSCLTNDALIWVGPTKVGPYVLLPVTAATRAERPSVWLINRSHSESGFGSKTVPATLFSTRHEPWAVSRSNWPGLQPAYPRYARNRLGSAPAATMPSSGSRPEVT